MSIQQVFERYEKKYLLTAEQEALFLKAIDGKMVMDGYGEHTICNIYYDTGNYKLIRKSLEHPLYKEKLRLRTYGVPKNGSHQAFIEIKKKFNHVVYKRRIAMPLQEAEDYLNEGIRPKKESQILHEIDWFLKTHAVTPSVCLSYSRRAFYEFDNPEFRLTIDKNIIGRYDRLKLREGIGGDFIIPEDMRLLEIKIPGTMPLWMSKVLSELKIFSVSISKYGRYFSQTPEINRGFLERI